MRAPVPDKEPGYLISTMIEHDPRLVASERRQITGDVTSDDVSPKYYQSNWTVPLTSAG